MDDDVFYSHSREHRLARLRELQRTGPPKSIPISKRDGSPTNDVYNLSPEDQSWWIDAVDVVFSSLDPNRQTRYDPLTPSKMRLTGSI